MTFKRQAVSKQFTLRFTPDQVELMDRVAECLGTNRTDLVREAMDTWFATPRGEQALAQIKTNGETDH